VGKVWNGAFGQDEDDKAFKIGYVGGERCVWLTITPAGNNAAALISALAILAKPKVAPTP
jgi:hypothetical protein